MAAMAYRIPMPAFRWAMRLGIAAVLPFAFPSHTFAAGDRGSWSVKAPLPVPGSEVGVASAGGRIYVMGGDQQLPGAPPRFGVTANFAYDPASNSWEARAPIPVGASHPGVAVLDGRIYVFGGFRTPIHMGPLATAFVYDPAADTWTALPDMPTARGSVAVAAVGNEIHVLGGRRSDRVVKFTPPGGPEMQLGMGTVASHDIYDLRTGKWSAGPPIPGPARDHMGVAVLDGKIHVFGGRINDFSDLLDRHDVYDPTTGRWSSAAPLPEKRSAGAYTVLDGRILYAGGECKPGGTPYSDDTFDVVDAYDPATDKWTALAPLPHGRQAFGAASIGRTAYFASGAMVCGGGASAEMIALTLP